MQLLVNEESRRPGFHILEPAAGTMSIGSLVALAILVTFYFATSLYISSHRLLWVDEVLTVLNTRVPSWTDIWKTSTQGVDGLPPVYFMVVRIFDNLFGHTDLSIRLPSALAMTAGLLLTFDCARRVTDGLHGLVALAVLTCSFLPYYGHEARSYALYFMFASLALWIWARDRNESRRGAALFGAAFFLAVAMHYYAILCLVPYAVWELWNWRPGACPHARPLRPCWLWVVLLQCCGSPYKPAGACFHLASGPNHHSTCFAIHSPNSFQTACCFWPWSRCGLLWRELGMRLLRSGPC